MTATQGVPNSSRGTKSALAHKWADWLHNPCHLEGPQRFGRGEKLPAHMWADGFHNPYLEGGHKRFRVGAHNHKGPTNGWIGYITLAV